MADSVVPDGIRPLIESLRRGPTSVALTSESHGSLTRVAVGLAAQLDPEFAWFDIRSVDSESPSWHVALAAEFPGVRLRTIDVGEMKLDDMSGNLAASMLVRSEPADSSFATLSDLMRIPEALRDAALGNPPDAAPKVLLITNTERASAAFSGAPGALRPYIEALNRFGLTVVVTAHGPGRENRHDCDVVLLVRHDHEARAVRSKVMCETIRSPERFPELSPGMTFEGASLEPHDGMQPPLGASRTPSPQPPPEPTRKPSSASEARPRES
ncbi:MAG: hypothetical protein WB809_04090 [Thermoplasmata archaeon]